MQILKTKDGASVSRRERNRLEKIEGKSFHSSFASLITTGPYKGKDSFDTIVENTFFPEL